MNILLAGDQNIVRNGIKLLLEFEKRYNVIDDLSNEDQILDKVKRNEIDLVIIDPESSGIDGILLTRKIKLLNVGTKVMILTDSDQKEKVLDAFFAGADGYVLKNAKPDELLFALKHLKDGGKYMCAELSMKFLNQQLHVMNSHDLSKARTIEFSVRETEILQLIAQGLTNTQMSDKLFISKRTIEGHRQSLLEKTGARNTASLIRFAVQNQLID